MIKTIIFDYDGVIVDSFSGVYKIYKKICSQLKKDLPDTIDGFRKLYSGTFIKLYSDLGIVGDEKEIAEGIFCSEIHKKTQLFLKELKKFLKN